MGIGSRLSVRRPLINLAGMIILWCGLPAWRALAQLLDCWAAGAIVCALAALMALSATEVAFYRRHAFVNHYLAPAGRLARLLSHRTVMVLWQGAKSLLLAMLLLIGVLCLSRAEWLALLADVLVMAGLAGALSGLLRPELRAIYRAPMARHAALRANAALLWLALLRLVLLRLALL